jgi:hypothetical protein
MRIDILNQLNLPLSLEKSKKFKIIYFFIISIWFSLCISINTKPGEIYQIFDSLVEFINGVRFLAPLVLTIISVSFLILLFIKKKIKKISILLTLFFLYFLSQLIGLINTPSRDFDLESIYLPIFAFGALSILIILDNNKSKKVAHTILIITLLFFSFAYFFIIFKNPETFFLSILDGSLYGLFNPYSEILGQASPRITGATRIMGIVSLFCAVLFFVPKKNNKVNLALYSFILFLSWFIWLGQSRGSLLCYYLTLFFLVYILRNISLIYKTIFVLSILIFSIIIAQSTISLSFQISKLYSSVSNNEELKKKIKNIENQKIENIGKQNQQDVDTNLMNARVLSNYSSSGRFQLWKISIKKYEKDKIFGYGPQGDRYILYNNELQDFFSTNSSNLLVYGFLSGGYVGLIILLIIYIYVSVILLKYFLIKKIYLSKQTITKNNFIDVFSIVVVIFFLIRSLFENSYGLFSVDFLFMIIATYILELNYKNKFR